MLLTLQTSILLEISCSISPVGGMPSACVSPLREFSFCSSPAVSLIFRRRHASMAMGWEKRGVGGFINVF